MGKIEKLLSKDSIKKIINDEKIVFDINKVKQIDKNIEKLDRFIKKNAIKKYLLSVLTSIPLIILILENLVDKKISFAGEIHLVDIIMYLILTALFLFFLWERELILTIKKKYNIKWEVFKFRKWDKDILKILKILMSLTMLIIILNLSIKLKVPIMKNLIGLPWKLWIELSLMMFYISSPIFIIFIFFLAKNKYNYYFEPNVSIAKNIADIIEEINIFNNPVQEAKFNEKDEFNRKEIVYRIKYTASLIENSNYYVKRKDIEMMKAAESFENYCNLIYYPRKDSFLNLEREMIKKLKIVIDEEIYLLIDDSIVNPKSRKWWKNIKIEVKEIFDINLIRYSITVLLILWFIGKITGVKIPVWDILEKILLK